jgi:hypothetical protein
MKIVSRSRTWLLVGLAVADLVVFAGSDPHSAPTLVLFIGFLLLAANFYVLLLGLLKLTAWYGISPGRHRKRFIRLATGLFGGLVALQSIGELSSRDLLVLLPSVVLAYLYISYGPRGHTEQDAVRVPLS